MNVHNPEHIRQHAAYQKAKQNLWYGGKPTQKLLAAPLVRTIVPMEITVKPSKAESQVNRIRLLEAQVQERDLKISDLQASALRMAEMIAAFLAKEAHDEEQADIDAELRVPMQPRRPIRVIVEEVLRDYPDVSWEDVKSVRRSRRLTGPRHQCMLAVYEQRPDLSYPAIARYFDRDHTTVLHAVKKFEALRGNP